MIWQHHLLTNYLLRIILILYGKGNHHIVCYNDKLSAIITTIHRVFVYDLDIHKNMNNIFYESNYITKHGVYMHMLHSLHSLHIYYIVD